MRYMLYIVDFRLIGTPSENEQDGYTECMTNEGQKQTNGNLVELLCNTILFQSVFLN